MKRSTTIDICSPERVVYTSHLEIIPSVEPGPNNQDINTSEQEDRNNNQYFVSRIVIPCPNN